MLLRLLSRRIQAVGSVFLGQPDVGSYRYYCHDNDQESRDQRVTVIDRRVLGVLVELNEALRAYRRDFVLVGGWAPYFITKPHFDHCGSIDIDLVFGSKYLRKYESIRDVIGALGFVPTDNPFRFSREVNENPTVELDFLSEEEALKAIPPGFVRVQEDLSAVIIPGSSVALALTDDVFRCQLAQFHRG